MSKNKPKGRLIGRCVVSDPEICHGKPTFRGTRIMVSHVLEMVAEGISWESWFRHFFVYFHFVSFAYFAVSLISLDTLFVYLVNVFLLLFQQPLV